ncbi:MAG TPA: iron ABC transporter permease [Thermoanaerobaculia bacterium]|jgi:iron complex transport system permease protein|nr:iron ABC transporter permease [Thermoanaerobaculia bacterium]
MAAERTPLTRRRLLGWCAGMAALLGVCMLLGVTLGSGGTASLAHLLGWGRPASTVESVILLRVRLPRVLLAAVLGGALTGAGIAFQALLRNPLADPYVLGVSGGASVGGVLALIFGLGSLQTAAGRFGAPVFAFAGALAALLLIEWIATVNGRLTVYTILLTGAVFNAFSGAVIYFLQSVASLQELHAIVFYLMGSVPSYGYATVGALAAASILAMVGLFSQARFYNALSLGEEGATQLGIDVERLKRRTFLLGALLTGLAVAFAGLIGFVGLIVPHLLRLALGPDHRLLLPAGFLGGAAFLVVADLLARLLVAPNELPVGVVTALIGGPFFLYLMRRNRGRYGVV